MVDLYNFTVSEKICFSKIQQLENNILTMNLEDIANYCSVSTATINRTLKKIGFKNLKDYKLSLNSPRNLTTQNTQTLLEKKIISLIDTLTRNELEIYIDLISNSDTIYIVGFGLSTSIALDFCLNLRKHNKNCIYINDSDSLKIINEKQLTSSDLIIYLSYSGNDSDMNLFASIAKNKAYQFLITSNPNAELIKTCSHYFSTDSYMLTQSFNSRIPLSIFIYKILNFYIYK